MIEPEPGYRCWVIMISVQGRSWSPPGLPELHGPAEAAAACAALNAGARSRDDAWRFFPVLEVERASYTFP